jgi:hypothetical protein
MHIAVLVVVIASIPPAAKTLAVIGSVYGLLQAAKKIPVLTQYITGWVAIALNVLLSACGLLVAVPADQLYTTNTLLLLLTTGMGAAGIHGTVQNLSPPTVLATVPPSTKVVDVPATLVPDDPGAVAVKKDEK